MNYETETCLFIGNFYEEESLASFISHSQLSLGNDNYEKTFISILENTFNKVSCVSFPALPKFSHKFPFLFIKGRHLVKKNTSYEFLPFFNSRFFIFRNHILNKEIKRQIKSSNVRIVFLSTFHMTPQIDYISKKFPNIKVVLLLPDLPSIEVSRLSPFAKIYMKRINKKFKDSINSVDLLLPITDKEASAIPFYKNDIMVYESCFDCSVFDSLSSGPKQKKILYAGSLNKNYGVLDLIEAFLSIDVPNYSLVICGKGDCSNIVAQLAKKNNNIEYLGQIKHEEVLKLEKESEIIVCPDKIKREFSFHSKYLEYLSSGTPVISFFPHGAKKEYIQFLYLVENNGGTLKEALRKALFTDLDEMKKRANEAKEFIRTKKCIQSFSAEMIKALNNIFH